MAEEKAQSEEVTPKIETGPSSQRTGREVRGAATLTPGVEEYVAPLEVKKPVTTGNEPERIKTKPAEATPTKDD